MQDEPSRLLRNPDFLRQLQAGNALAGRDQQIHRVNPLVQRDMAALENGSRPHRKGVKYIIPFSIWFHVFCAMPTDAANSLWFSEVIARSCAIRSPDCGYRTLSGVGGITSERVFLFATIPELWRDVGPLTIQAFPA